MTSKSWIDGQIYKIKAKLYEKSYTLLAKSAEEDKNRKIECLSKEVDMRNMKELSDIILEKLSLFSKEMPPKFYKEVVILIKETSDKIDIYKLLAVYNAFFRNDVISISREIFEIMYFYQENKFSTIEDLHRNSHQQPCGG